MIYRAYCGKMRLNDFMTSRGWSVDELADWLGVPLEDAVRWLGGVEEIPGPVARLVQVEDSVGPYLNRKIDDREDLILGAYFDAKNAFRLEYHLPDKP